MKTITSEHIQEVLHYADKFPHSGQNRELAEIVRHLLIPSAPLVAVGNTLPEFGKVTVTTNEQGECIAVTRTDDEHRVLSVIWMRASTSKATRGHTDPIQIIESEDHAGLLIDGIGNYYELANNPKARLQSISKADIESIRNAALEKAAHRWGIAHGFDKHGVSEFIRALKSATPSTIKATIHDKRAAFEDFYRSDRRIIPGTPGSLHIENMWTAWQARSEFVVPTIKEENSEEMSYAIALQHAIEAHCRGEQISQTIGAKCPHHANLLNDNLPMDIKVEPTNAVKWEESQK